MNRVGRRVKEARLKFIPPLSQKDLSLLLQSQGWQISRGGLAKIESGLRQVIDTEILLLSRTLKVSTDWLINFNEHTDGQNEE
jgi:hypothetical protein